MPTVQVYPSAADLNEAAADFIVTSALEAIERSGRFTFALSGGSTPEKVYALLAERSRASKIDWTKVFVFVGDERYVPYEDERSNYGMGQRQLLNHVPIPAENLHPIPTDLATPAEAAEAYAKTLADFFELPVNGKELPSLDLNLLGLGDDGHTASLFPGMPTVHVTDKWTVSTPAGTLPPPVDRVSLTFPVLNAAKIILMLVAGEKKATVVSEVLEMGPSPDVHPAVNVRPAKGNQLMWMIDRGAASKVAAKSLS